MSPPLPITEDDLEGFVEDVLDAGPRAAVQTYLDGHPEEARRIATYVAQRALLRDALRSIAEEPVPPQLGLSQAQRQSYARPCLRCAMAAALGNMTMPCRLHQTPCSPEIERPVSQYASFRGLRWMVRRRVVAVVLLRWDLVSVT
jgi:anti-sigma factor RsiW